MGRRNPPIFCEAERKSALVDITPHFLRDKALNSSTILSAGTIKTQKTDT
jgi:hypothetical protein